MQTHTHTHTHRHPHLLFAFKMLTVYEQQHLYSTDEWMVLKNKMSHIRHDLNPAAFGIMRWDIFHHWLRMHCLSETLVHVNVTFIYLECIITFELGLSAMDSRVAPKSIANQGAAHRSCNCVYRDENKNWKISPQTYFIGDKIARLLHPINKHKQ